LVAIMLTGMRVSTQTERDAFFAHLHLQAQLVHEVSEQASSQARAKLSLTAVPRLNDWLIARAEEGPLCRAGAASAWAPLTPRRYVLAGALAMSNLPLADLILFGLILPRPDRRFPA
jgi:hypothetical protein